MWTVAVCGQGFAEAHQEMEVSRTDPTWKPLGGAGRSAVLVCAPSQWQPSGGCKESRVLVTTGMAVFEWDLSGAF